MSEKPKPIVICGTGHHALCEVWKTDPCSDCPIVLHFSAKSDNWGSEREKLIDKIKEINEKHRNDPESIKRKQEICKQLSKLTSEDLSKRITLNSDKLGSGGE